jgi:hypothetical protein
MNPQPSSAATGHLRTDIMSNSCDPQTGLCWSTAHGGDEETVGVDATGNRPPGAMASATWSSTWLWSMGTTCRGSKAGVADGGVSDDHGKK